MPPPARPPCPPCPRPRLQWPWCVGARRRSQPQFFGRDAWLGLLTAAVMGLQHAMAMLAGLTTVPLLLGINAFSVSPGQQCQAGQPTSAHAGLSSAARPDAAACAQQPPPRVHVPCTLTRLPSAHTPPLVQDPTLSPADATRYQQYLISATLIVSGMSTAIQVTGIPLPLKRQWGAGILSVSRRLVGRWGCQHCLPGCLHASQPASQPSLPAPPISHPSAGHGSQLFHL